MTTTAETLRAQAARLPPAERIELVEGILDSLDQTDGAMDILWAKEAGGRLTAYRRGEVKAVSSSDAIERRQVTNMSAASAPITPASDLAQAALAALSRARLRAAEDALRANTHMVVAVDGKVLYESPQDYLRKRDEPATQPNAKPRA
jgi:putative addiction module component (TIGR02574 family)